MMLIRSQKHRMLLWTVILVVVGAATWLGYHALAPGKTYVIRSSYAFDVNDTRQLAGQADALFVGTVSRVAGVEKGPQTIFAVAVEEVLKGDLNGTVLVRQLGGTVGKDTWVLDDQAALLVGRTYVLVVTRSVEQPGAYTLLAGPRGHELLGSTQARVAALNDWREAVRNQREPDALRPPR